MTVTRGRLTSALRCPALAAAAVLVLPSIALAAPSGLTVIPTADILDANTASIESEADGRTAPFAHDCDRRMLLQVGLAARAEAGIDFSSTADEGPWLNVKALLREEDATHPAVAVGLQGLGTSGTAEPYVVLCKSLSPVRAHLGLILTGRRARMMVGVDAPLSDRVGVCADFINGADNTTSIGLFGDVAEGVGMTIGRIFANEGAGGDTWYFNLAYEAQFGQY